MVKFERGRVGTGSVLALDAIGKQDTYLYNEKLEDSRWDPSYTQSTNFAITQRTVTLPGSNWINHEIKVEFIPKSCGDMFSNMHLQCSLPALPPGNVYTDQIGRAIFSQVDFLIDGQVIESLNDDWYILRDQLFLDADEKNAMAQAINGGYSEGTLSTLSSTPQIDMIIPLDFFFCRRHSRYKKHRERLDRPYFPTCALYNQKIYLNFKFQPWSWFSNSIADTRTGYISMNTPLVIYTTSTSNTIGSSDSNIYVNDDISFWPNSNGSITIDSEQMTYNLKTGSYLSGLVRPYRTTHASGAPITLTSTTGFTYTSNIVVYPMSNCVTGMYIYGIPTLGGTPAVINSIDSANNILNITYNNIIPSSQTYTLSFSFSSVSRQLTIPSTFIRASDHYTFTVDSSTNLYPGMQLNGTDLVGGGLYIRGIPVIAANNINQFLATNITASYVAGNTICSFTINSSVPYLTVGTTYVNFPGLVVLITTNVAGTSLTANVADNYTTKLNGVGASTAVVLDSPSITGNYVTISYPWQEPVITGNAGSLSVSFSDNITKTAFVNFGSPIDMTTTSNVIFINNRSDLFTGMQVTGMPAITGYAYISSKNGNYYTVSYPSQTQVSIGFPFSATDSNIVTSGSITFWPDINGSINIASENMLYGQKLNSNLMSISRSSIYQGNNKIGSNVVLTSLISEGANNLSTLTTTITNVQTAVTLSGNLASWPSSGVVLIEPTEVCTYTGLTGQNITLARNVYISTSHASGTNVLLQNTFSLITTLATNIGSADTVITLTGNITSWPSTGTVLLETNEVCTYSGKSGQTITLSRGSYPRSHAAFTNVIYQNTYTISTLGVAMNRTSNTFTLTTSNSSLYDWPTTNAAVVIDNEFVSYGLRVGNVFSNCFNRNLTWSTHFVGESIYNLRDWEYPITIQNLTDFISPPKLIIEEAQLTDEEREYTKTNERRIVVNHVQKQPPLYFDQGTNGQISIGIGANFPVTFLCWFIRRGVFETLNQYVDSRYSYGYTTKYINTSTPITFFNGVKLNYLDLIQNSQISLSGNPILSNFVNGVYFTMKQPFDHSLSVPTKSVYVYAFGMNPKEYNQGGFMDFSPLNASTTTLSISFLPQYATELAKAFSLYLFYYGYTILEVKNGFGRLVFV